MDGKSLAAMADSYLEQRAYFRLPGPIPDFWDPLARATGKDFADARKKCKALVERVERTLKADFSDDQLCSMADTLAAFEAGQDIGLDGDTDSFAGWPEAELAKINAAIQGFCRDNSRRARPRP